MIRYFLGLPRFSKRVISVIADSLLIAIAYWGGYWVRLDDAAPFHSNAHWLLLACFTPITILCFVKLGLYRAVLRYVSFRVLLTVLTGVTFSTVLLVSSAFYFSVFLPRSTSIIYFAFAFIFIGGIRLFFRMIVQRQQGARVPVLIYGAGSSGRQLHLALNQAAEFMPVAYIDDDKKMKNTTIQGLMVYSPEHINPLIQRYSAEKILLAMPSVSRARRKEVIGLLESLSCEVLSVPSMVDLVTGTAKIDELNEVSIDDLLGRDSVPPDIELMQKNIQHKIVAVTGAGGSIGSELCRQIINLSPEVLVLFDHSEYALYEIDKELNQIVKYADIPSTIIPIIGSVQNRSRLQSVLSQYQVNTVYHAAAYKHVPLVEYNVVEGIRNNVFGTLNCAKAAMNANVSSFVLISTDKAVRPTNVMGASKRIAELVLQALAKEQSNTVFCMVRFGNVLGSSGSVVPLFRKQIQQGGPVTVTDPEIIRYFMTIPEASQLVIQAGAMGTGGDVFVLDMGKPVKIVDLASRMIRLTGLTVKDSHQPNGDIEVKITGLRPGEKLYEELLIGDSVEGTAHPRIMTANEAMLPWKELEQSISQIDLACQQYDLNSIREIILNMPTGFSPTDGIGDLIWQQMDNSLEQRSLASNQLN